MFILFQIPIVLSTDFWVSLECIEADISIFRQFMNDFDICDDYLDQMLIPYHK